ncbi:MAG: hypothetical protein LUH01_14130, partial [Parabacteroides gordonii]|nr:hypothetical protein [Parabacteroides gordonii]
MKFVAENTIKDIKDNAENPALFALRVTESGNYLLENQMKSSTPFVGIVNNVVVMAENGAE